MSLSEDESKTLTCALCGREEDEHEAIPRGWIPDYIDEDGATRVDPVCVECCAARITTNEDGDSILIKEQS